MSNQNVLPTVLMLLANSGAILPSPASALAVPADSTVSSSAMPIAAMFTATNEAREPARLQSWVADLVNASSAPSLDDPWSRCMTISGSGDGWDDSRQDC
jgi:hypothetical protein